MEDRKTAEALDVLVVDDDRNIRRTLALCLESEGHRVVCAAGTPEALAEATHRSFDIAFVDLHLGDTDGLDLIPALLTASPWLKVIVMTAYASLDSAVEAMRRGAVDYLAKPYTPAQVASSVRKVMEKHAMEQEVASLVEYIGRSIPGVDLYFASPVMERIFRIARQVAQTDATILLRGESGTGKTMLARVIHGWSPRAAHPFLLVSCRSLTAGSREGELFGHVRGTVHFSAHDAGGPEVPFAGGTLVLEEIGDLPDHLQERLLRFLKDQEPESAGNASPRQPGVRVIATTSTNLEKAVQEGRFRESLLPWINMFPLDIPPLRERKEEVPALAERLLAFYDRVYGCSHLGLTEEAIATLINYAWPGNVRELGGVIERAVILCGSDYVGVEHLPGKLSAVVPLGVGSPITLIKLEEEHIRRVLSATKSLHEAAEILVIDPATLWRRRKQYGI